MIYSVNLMDLTEKINPLSFAKYLKDTGWRQYPSRRTDVRIFQYIAASGEAFQVMVPVEKMLSDYKDAMYQAVETVAVAEERSMDQLMLFLLNPNTDILKIRLDRKGIEAGNILFDDAIRVYENARKLIAAATQDILHPRRYHQGRPEDAVSKFVNNCKFGQTEIGSYVVSIVCPFAELDETEGYRQLSIFSEEEQCANSLTRQVTNRIMTNVSSIKNNIDNGDYGGLVPDGKEPVISINFYEALAGLNPDIEDTDVEFIAQWSPAVKKNRSASSRILLSHDYHQPIVSAIDRFRRTASTKQKILGRIKRLESAPDVTKRDMGKITIVYLDENDRKRTATANLSKRDYDKAIEAHEKGLHVEVVGEITGKTGNTMNCEFFDIIG